MYSGDSEFDPWFFPLKVFHIKYCLACGWLFISLVLIIGFLDFLFNCTKRKKVIPKIEIIFG